MKIKKKKVNIFIYLFIGLFVCSHISAETVNDIDNVYIFIDISGSVTDVFDDIQMYVNNNIIPKVEKGQRLTIFKFYRKMVVIFDKIIQDEDDIKFAKQRVSLLLSNGPWTNINNVFDYIKRNNINPNKSKIFICTDGHAQEENNKNEYYLTNENIASYIKDVELIDKKGWFLCTFKSPSLLISETKQIEPFEQNKLTPLPKEIKTSQFNCNKKMALSFFIAMLIIILVAIVSYHFFKKQSKKSVALKQLSKIHNLFYKYLKLISVMMVVIIIESILFFFITQNIFCISLLICMLFLCLIVILGSVFIIYKTNKKSFEIIRIYNHLLEEAEKHDTDLEKEIDESSLENEKNLHKQLVLGIICVKVKEFDKKTELSKADTAFLFFAVALQCIRQYILTDFKDRVGDQDAAKNTIGEKNFDPHNAESDRKHRYYNPSLEEIISHPVPFDASNKSIEFGNPLKGYGKFGHRGATLGHDPILGLVFGTANIATSTLTTARFESFHIKSEGNRDYFSQNASTIKVLYYTKEKLLNQGLEGKKIIAVSLIKEVVHLMSDVNSKNSLPIPILTAIQANLPVKNGKKFSATWASDISKYGVDMANILNIGKQGTLAQAIDLGIAMIHRLTYDANEGDNKLFEVRTRKILLYSNIIATASNVLTVAIGTTTGLTTGNHDLGKTFLKKLDIGGFIVTLHRLKNDKAFIRKIKVDYILNNLEKKHKEN